MATEEAAVAWFTCESANPVRPTPPPNSKQLAWLYGYLTEFLAPCYEANGYDNPPAPTEAEFIADWPNQGWFPIVNDPSLAPDREAALNEACPPPA